MIVNYNVCLSNIYSCCLQDGVSPLHVAAQKGHKEVVATLLSAGADVNLAMQVRVGLDWW